MRCAGLDVKEGAAIVLAKGVPMRVFRLIPVLLLFLADPLADAHVGSPDVYFEGAAGPYHLLVTIKPPAMVPGVAEVQVCVTSGAVGSIRVAPVYVNGKD